jgi:hypothetical protein
MASDLKHALEIGTGAWVGGLELPGRLGLGKVSFLALLGQMS